MRSSRSFNVDVSLCFGLPRAEPSKPFTALASSNPFSPLDDSIGHLDPLSLTGPHKISSTTMLTPFLAAASDGILSSHDMDSVRNSLDLNLGNNECDVHDSASISFNNSSSSACTDGVRANASTTSAPLEDRVPVFSHSYFVKLPSNVNLPAAPLSAVLGSQGVCGNAAANAASLVAPPINSWSSLFRSLPQNVDAFTPRPVNTVVLGYINIPVLKCSQREWIFGPITWLASS